MNIFLKERKFAKFPRKINEKGFCIFQRIMEGYHLMEHIKTIFINFTFLGKQAYWPIRFIAELVLASLFWNRTLKIRTNKNYTFQMNQTVLVIYCKHYFLYYLLLDYISHYNCYTLSSESKKHPTLKKRVNKTSSYLFIAKTVQITVFETRLIHPTKKYNSA